MTPIPRDEADLLGAGMTEGLRSRLSTTPASEGPSLRELLGPAIHDKMLSALPPLTGWSPPAPEGQATPEEAGARLREMGLWLPASQACPTCGRPPEVPTEPPFLFLSEPGWSVTYSEPVTVTWRDRDDWCDPAHD